VSIVDGKGQGGMIRTLYKTSAIHDWVGVTMGVTPWFYFSQTPMGKPFSGLFDSRPDH